MALQLVRLKSFTKDSGKVKLTDRHFTRFVEGESVKLVRIDSHSQLFG